MRLSNVCVIALSVALSGGVLAQDQDHVHGGGEKLGTVVFPVSCNAVAQPHFNRAVTLLHSFEFGAAIDAFESTLKEDPSCAMAQWGIALSRWSNPFAVGLRSA